jgi:hypothetical protein
MPFARCMHPRLSLQRHPEDSNSFHACGQQQVPCIQLQDLIHLFCLLQDGRSMPAPTHSRSRESRSTAAGAEQKSSPPIPFISPSRDTLSLFSHHGDTQTERSIKAEECASGGDGFLPEEEGLLGQAANSSRDVPILPPGADSRDGLCREMSQDAHGWLMQPCAGEDQSSMHTLLEHSRLCNLGSAGASGVHGTAQLTLPIISPSSGSGASRCTPHEKCFEDSQVCSRMCVQRLFRFKCAHPTQISFFRSCAHERLAHCPWLGVHYTFHLSFDVNITNEFAISNSSSACCQTTACLEKPAATHLDF